MILRRLVRLAIMSIGLGLLVAASVAFAQEPVPAPPPAPVFDWYGLLFNVANALTPVVVMFSVWGLKLLWARMPANLVHIATMLLGLLVNNVLTGLTGDGYHPAVAVVLGWLAVSLREFLTTIPKGSSSVTITTGRL